MAAQGWTGERAMNVLLTICLIAGCVVLLVSALLFVLLDLLARSSSAPFLPLADTANHERRHHRPEVLADGY
jgi:hypothetical protein